MAPRRFVILDRDGTINRERHYLSDPNQVELLPGVVEGLRAMRSLGLGLLVATNQSGLARGYFDDSRLEAIHARLAGLLAEQDLRLDGVYSCPHHPDDGCECRKPKPGLLLQAAARHGFQPEQCFVIGDKPCDLQLGMAVNAQATFLVRSGYGRLHEHDPDLQADFVVDDLVEAAQVISRILRCERVMTDQAQKIFSLHRAPPGTDIRLGVGVAVRSSDGKILLERRSDCGMWGLPGGKVEPGESLQKTACREVLEETGLVIGITKLIGVYSHPYERIATYPDNVIHKIDVVMEGCILGGGLFLSHESLELRFFDLANLPKEVVPPAITPLEDILAGRRSVIS